MKDAFFKEMQKRGKEGEGRETRKVSGHCA